MKLRSPKIYRKKRAKNHSGIEINSNKTTWRNLVVTHSPIKSKRYIKLAKNLKKDDKKTIEKYLTKKVSVQPTKLGPSAHQNNGSNTNNIIMEDSNENYNKKS